MTQHAGPPSHSPNPDDREDAPIPEPTYAERARTLVYLARTGTLSTLSRKHAGHPFGSVMPYALDGRGRPLLLISAMAMHTQNLRADRRASLLVAEPGSQGEPLAAGRVTLMGEALPIGEAEGADTRTAYVARHPNAAYWLDFPDFGFYRLEISDVYFVGGFAAMDWVDAPAYLAARPDPLADAAAGIVEHMNRDHPDALLTFARLVARAEADAASMVAVDRLGFKLRIRNGSGLSSARVPFPREVRTAQEARSVLVEMLRQARGAA